MTHKLSTATSLDSHGSSPPLEGEVDPHEFVICRAADGTDVCLGEGNFGKARLQSFTCTLREATRWGCVFVSTLPNWKRQGEGTT